MSERPRAVSWGMPLAAGAALLVVYVLTLAPDLTFWDAGEFIAAAHTLGIPHPPGTPLFVVVLAAWTKLFAMLSFPVATNLFSAVVTSVAAVMSARLLARGTGDALAGAAGALCAGGMTSVWLNATETEVYAASLALSVAMVACAERAGRTRNPRWRVLVAYLMALAVPLHLSALLAAPAAIYLASTSDQERLDALTAAVLTGALLVLVGIGTAGWWVSWAGLLLLALSPLATRVARRIRRDGGGGGASDFVLSETLERPAPAARRRVLAEALAAASVVVLGLSAVIFMLIRARHDPAINQGNPSDWTTLEYVIARRQYLVAPILPRQAPWWLQIGNLFEYVDWQTALSLAPSVVPSVGRVACTIAFLVLGVVGSLAHRERDRRSWRGLALVTLFGSLGAVAYLNLKASPSFGWGVLPPDAIREARERDYFFVLGFWGWGLWAGGGAVALVRRLRRRPAIGLTIGALPIALNWRAVERRSVPESELPRRFAEAVLRDAPLRAVLFLGGDNDSYTIWMLQQVDGVRRDVTAVTLPLLNAGWNQREVARRTGLLPRGEPTRPALEAARRIAAAAGAAGRPVAADVMVSAPERQQIGSGWVVIGTVLVTQHPGAAAGNSTSGKLLVADPPTVDTVATRRSSDAIARWRRGRYARPSTDPVNSYMLDLLDCPSLYLARNARADQIRSLDSTCNRR